MTEFVGLAPEEFTPAQRKQAEGLWAAFRMYDPVNLPLRKIEAVGTSPAGVLREIATKGGDPAQYEAVRLHFLR